MELLQFIENIKGPFPQTATFKHKISVSPLRSRYIFQVRYAPGKCETIKGFFFCGTATISKIYIEILFFLQTATFHVRSFCFQNI